MLQTAVDLCKSAIDFINKRKDTKQETKLRISVILDEISGLLQDTADKFEKDEYPHFNCALLEKLVDHLHFYLMDHMAQREVDDIRETLIRATKVEDEFAKRHEENTIPDLKKAAGEFKAMSLMMKI